MGFEPRFVWLESLCALPLSPLLFQEPLGNISEQAHFVLNPLPSHSVLPKYFYKSSSQFVSWLSKGFIYKGLYITWLFGTQ